MSKIFNKDDHKPKKKMLIRFLLLLGVFLAYFGYLSWHYDIMTGGLLAVLTWSFFVLCTPIADAGALLDFPVRLITGLHMVVSEMFVWAIAISVNIWALNYAAEDYSKSFLTHLLYQILTTPWPYWSIIALCAAGTFISVWFGDTVMDAAGKDKDKGKKIKAALMVPLFAVVFVAYYFLLKSLHIDFSEIMG